MGHLAINERLLTAETMGEAWCPGLKINLFEASWFFNKQHLHLIACVKVHATLTKT